MKNKIKFILAAIVLVIIATSPLYLERVDAGEYKIAQQLDGDIMVLDDPGWQFTGYVSSITEYKEAGVYYFSSDDDEGETDEGYQPIEVIFKDGAIGLITGNFQFKLPSDKEARINLHKLYGRRYEAIIDNLIRKSVREAIISAATYFKGEEAYSYGKSAFIALMNKQIDEGIFATISEQLIVKDAEGNAFIENIVKVKQDSLGNNIINKVSKLKEFNVMNIGLTIDKTKLDSKTMVYIEKKKDAEFMKIQKRAESEQSKQDAITAAEKGKADVAKAKAIADVAKQTAVTEAEKVKEVAMLKGQQLLEVAKLNKQAAEEDAKAIIVRKEAEAKANALLVKAGLTPKERAEIEMKTKIGVAAELAKVKVPNIVIGGGNGGANPMEAVGVKYLMDINNKLSK